DLFRALHPRRHRSGHVPPAAAGKPCRAAQAEDHRRGTHRRRPAHTGEARLMFTGIVAAVGRIAKTDPAPGGLRLHIDTAGLDMADVALGDSIAVSGVCLTVVAFDRSHFEAEVSQATLSVVAGFAAGAPVNLEKALRLADRLGGHLVTGHVDGT